MDAFGDSERKGKMKKWKVLVSLVLVLAMVSGGQTVWAESDAAGSENQVAGGEASDTAEKAAAGDGQGETLVGESGTYNYTISGTNITLYYDLDDSSNITLTDCNEDAKGDLSIPSVINGHKVTGIGDSAFNSCLTLTSVMIPSGVTSIGDYAFNYCSALTSVSRECPAAG